MNFINTVILFSTLCYIFLGGSVETRKSDLFENAKVYRRIKRNDQEAPTMESVTTVNEQAEGMPPPSAAGKQFLPPFGCSLNEQVVQLEEKPIVSTLVKTEVTEVGGEAGEGYTTLPVESDERDTTPISETELVTAEVLTTASTDISTEEANCVDCKTSLISKLVAQDGVIPENILLSTYETDVPTTSFPSDLTPAAEEEMIIIPVELSMATDSGSPIKLTNEEAIDTIITRVVLPHTFDTDVHTSEPIDTVVDDGIQTEELNTQSEDIVSQGEEVFDTLKTDGMLLETMLPITESNFQSPELLNIAAIDGDQNEVITTQAEDIVSQGREMTDTMIPDDAVPKMEVSTPEMAIQSSELVGILAGDGVQNEVIMTQAEDIVPQGGEMTDTMITDDAVPVIQVSTSEADIQSSELVDILAGDGIQTEELNTQSDDIVQQGGEVFDTLKTGEMLPVTVLPITEADTQSPELLNIAASDEDQNEVITTQAEDIVPQYGEMTDAMKTDDAVPVTEVHTPESDIQSSEPMNTVSDDGVQHELATTQEDTTVSTTGLSSDTQQEYVASEFTHLASTEVSELMSTDIQEADQATVVPSLVITNEEVEHLFMDSSTTETAQNLPDIRIDLATVSTCDVTRQVGSEFATYLPNQSKESEQDVTVSDPVSISFEFSTTPELQEQQTVADVTLTTDTDTIFSEHEKDVSPKGEETALLDAGVTQSSLDSGAPAISSGTDLEVTLITTETLPVSSIQQNLEPSSSHFTAEFDTALTTELELITEILDSTESSDNPTSEPTDETLPVISTAVPTATILIDTTKDALEAGQEQVQSTRDLEHVVVFTDNPSTSVLIRNGQLSEDGSGEKSSTEIQLPVIEEQPENKIETAKPDSLEKEVASEVSHSELEVPTEVTMLVVDYQSTNVLSGSAAMEHSSDSEPDTTMSTLTVPQLIKTSSLSTLDGETDQSDSVFFGLGTSEILRTVTVSTEEGKVDFEPSNPYQAAEKGKLSTVPSLAEGSSNLATESSLFVTSELHPLAAVTTLPVGFENAVITDLVGSPELKGFSTAVIIDDNISFITAVPEDETESQPVPTSTPAEPAGISTKCLVTEKLPLEMSTQSPVTDALSSIVRAKSTPTTSFQESDKGTTKLILPSKLETDAILKEAAEKLTDTPLYSPAGLWRLIKYRKQYEDRRFGTLGSISTRPTSMERTTERMDSRNIRQFSFSRGLIVGLALLAVLVIFLLIGLVMFVSWIHRNRMQAASESVIDKFEAPHSSVSEQNESKMHPRKLSSSALPERMPVRTSRAARRQFHVTSNRQTSESLHQRNLMRRRQQHKRARLLAHDALLDDIAYSPQCRPRCISDGDFGLDADRNKSVVLVGASTCHRSSREIRRSSNVYLPRALNINDPDDYLDASNSFIGVDTPVSNANMLNDNSMNNNGNNDTRKLSYSTSNRNGSHLCSTNWKYIDET